MKVVALVSGGKDSCMNMLYCLQECHEIVALANVHPADDVQELDSYMYQSVGHGLLPLWEEATGLQLFRERVHGTAVCQTLDYDATPDDETESLVRLLRRVRAVHAFEAVSVGAILSQYQRLRVEHVCARLGLQTLTYLWMQDQAGLLAQIAATVDARIIKVAALGLEEHHLGKSLAEVQGALTRLHAKYGVHPCGEGGEYETFVMDAPIFVRRIVVDATILHRDSGGVAYLQCEGHTEPKESVPLPQLQPVFPALHPLTLLGRDEYDQSSGRDGSARDGSGRDASGSGMAWPTLTGIRARGTIPDALAALVRALKDHGMALRNVHFISLVLRDMSCFAECNRIYASFFSFANPPARACIAARTRTDLDLLALCSPSSARTALHVQSISHWAPANIGPYAQAVCVDGAVFVAGQIPLQPACMRIVHGYAPVDLALMHALRIVDAVAASVRTAVVYVTSALHVSDVWRAAVVPDLCIQVLALPRDAPVEWCLTAASASFAMQTEVGTLARISSLLPTVVFATLYVTAEIDGAWDGVQTIYAEAIWTAMGQHECALYFYAG